MPSNVESSNFRTLESKLLLPLQRLTFIVGQKTYCWGAENSRLRLNPLTSLVMQIWDSNFSLFPHSQNKKELWTE